MSHIDFEDLARDLISKELGVRFEAFGPGPDGGMDGRHTSAKNTIIMQAKHYQGSTFASLKSAMKKERKSIDALTLDRYLLVTSRSLTKDQKAKIADEIGPALKSESDIFAVSDLESLLKKARRHRKIPCKTVAFQFNRPRNAPQRRVYRIFKCIPRRNQKKVRVFVQNPSLPEATNKLETEHIVIISGPPGFGKTTLAEMVSFSYIAEGWNFIAIRDLDEGFALLNDSKKQLFFLDDFLGQVALDPAALAHKDANLIKFMKRVSKSPNARFVLTTRAYILEAARNVSEHMAHDQISLSRYLLDVGIYTRRHRAKILYNHLHVSEIPTQYVWELIESEQLINIVDHKNYSPRIISTMTELSKTKGIEASSYPEEFLKALDNPFRIWDIAFRTQIDDRCRNLLFALFFSSEYGVKKSELRGIFDAVHSELSAAYGYSVGPKDLEESIKILEGGFVAIRGNRVSFVNPSLRDYLKHYLDNQKLLGHLAEAARKADWVQTIWKHVKSAEWASSSVHRYIALKLKKVAMSFSSMPVMIKDTEKLTPGYFTIYQWGLVPSCP